jgi:p-aminobenzoyl-glutamate transporter AbgT
MVGWIGGVVVGLAGILLRAHVVLGLGFAVAGATLILFAREIATVVVRGNSTIPAPLNLSSDHGPFVRGVVTWVAVVFAVSGVIIAVFGDMR